MSGIAGLISVNGELPDLAQLGRMLDSLRHRGPDGERMHAAGSVRMGETQLHLDGDGPVEAELVADMARTRGGGCASARHYPREDRVELARDPFGIKPLYYAETACGFAFASELRAFLDSGLAPRNVRAEARDELLQLQFTTGSETIFDGIQRVLPGETLVVSEGRIVERRRSAALPEGGPANWSEAEALKRLDQALTDSVTAQATSTAPCGMFLSGGVDSAVLLAMMARLNRRPLRAYTAGFCDTAQQDERAQARLLAAKVGAEHVEVEFSEADFWNLLPQVIADIDDPAINYAVLPIWKLAREAAKDLKIVLSGDGGSEMFAGYGRYRSALRPWWLGGRAMRPRGIFDGLRVLRRQPAGWRDGIVAAESTAELPGRTRLQIAQAVDSADWLPNDPLIKLDRCLMAHSLEGRTPFLDPAVAEVAFRLPDDLKIRKGFGKYLLRCWLAAHLPEAESLSRKRGATVPVIEWLGRRADRIAPLVAAQPGIAELCQPGSVEKLFRKTGKRAGFAVWTLLFYALWHQHHVLGVKPEGDAFEMLSVRA